MTLTERVAYIRGLMEGLGLDADSKETKVLNAMLELLDDMALTVTDLDGDIDDICDEIEEIEEEIDLLEEDVDDLYEDFDDDDCCCDEDEYELKCSNCGDTVIVDEDMLFGDEEIFCPNCGAQFPEMDLECACGDCDCDCDCE